MDAPFPATAEALRDLAIWEEHRIEFTHWQALTGGCEPVAGIAFAGWKERLLRLKAACAILTALAPYEDQIRAMVPELSRQPLPRPSEITWNR